MPTSLSTPVVVPALRCSAGSRALLAPEVVRDPDRRHREDARLCGARVSVRERQPQPAVVLVLGPERAGCRGAAGHGGGSPTGRGRWRGARADLGLGDGEAGADRLRGHRRLAAEAGGGWKTASRALCVSLRLRERLPRVEAGGGGSVGAARFAIPKPPCLRANTAIVTSASPSRSGCRSPPRSASQSRRSVAAARSPRVGRPLPCRGAAGGRRARPRPRRRWPSRHASRRRQRRSPPPESAPAVSTVVPIRASSLRGDQDGQWPSHPRPGAARSAAAAGRRCHAHAVVAGRVRVGEDEQRRQRADRVDAVDGRELVALEHRDCACSTRVGSTPTTNAGAAEPR